MGQQIKNQAITRQETNFAQWYTDVVQKAELMDYSSVKGFIDYLPYGYAIWENIQGALDPMFKAHDVENVYLPLVIPSSLFNKEKEHVEGFAPECLVATIGGGKKLEDPLVIRPTSEVLFSDLYKRLVSSYRDLPKIFNQWCSVVRWEKTTRPFLRGSEFLWQEGHCLFETEEEAEKNAKDFLEIYDTLGRDYLAIPFIKGKKTEHEKFAGAVNTYTVEALMPDGKALQAGTTHYLGQGFAEGYGISYQGRNNALEYPHQTSWGVSTRLIGALIMVHGDDNGLILPPKVAPLQAVIIPIRSENPQVQEACSKILASLKEKGVRAKIDRQDNKTPGFKYAYYEMRGVPLRIEVGPRDLEKGKVVIALRVDNEKHEVDLNDVSNKVVEFLDFTHHAMYDKAKAYLEHHISEAHSVEELKNILDTKGGFVKMAFCGKEECELKIKELTNGGTARCIIEENVEGEVCPICGEKATIRCYFAKAY